MVKKKIEFDDFSIDSMYEFSCEIYGKRIEGDFTVRVTKEDMEIESVSAFDGGDSMVQIQDKEIIAAIKNEIEEKIYGEHVAYYEDKLAADGDHAYDCWKDDQL